MTTLERFLVAIPIGLGLGLPIYLPWLLARLGYYERRQRAIDNGLKTSRAGLREIIPTIRPF